MKPQTMFPFGAKSKQRYSSDVWRTMGFNEPGMGSSKNKDRESSDTMTKRAGNTELGARASVISTQLVLRNQSFISFYGCSTKHYPF